MYSGELLKKFRNLLGLKQEVVAKNLDVTQQAVAKLESKKEVCENTILKYLCAMNTTKEDFEKFVSFYPPPKISDLILMRCSVSQQEPKSENELLHCVQYD